MGHRNTQMINILASSLDEKKAELPFLDSARNTKKVGMPNVIPDTYDMNKMKTIILKVISSISYIPYWPNSNSSSSSTLFF